RVTWKKTAAGARNRAWRRGSGFHLPTEWGGGPGRAAAAAVGRCSSPEGLGRRSGVRRGVIQGRRARCVFTSHRVGGGRPAAPWGAAAPAAQRPRRWGVAAVENDWEE